MDAYGQAESVFCTEKEAGNAKVDLQVLSLLVPGTIMDAYGCVMAAAANDRTWHCDCRGWMEQKSPGSLRETGANHQKSGSA
jgi:hypothetical protein